MSSPTDQQIRGRLYLREDGTHHWICTCETCTNDRKDQILKIEDISPRETYYLPCCSMRGTEVLEDRLLRGFWYLLRKEPYPDMDEDDSATMMEQDLEIAHREQSNDSRLESGNHIGGEDQPSLRMGGNAGTFFDGFLTRQILYPVGHSPASVSSASGSEDSGAGESDAEEGDAEESDAEEGAEKGDAKDGHVEGVVAK